MYSCFSPAASPFSIGVHVQDIVNRILIKVQEADLNCHKRALRPFLNPTSEHPCTSFLRTKSIIRSQHVPAYRRLLASQVVDCQMRSSVEEDFRKKVALAFDHCINE